MTQTSSGVPALSSAMQEVQDKYIAEAHLGQMGGKKVTPSGDFCTKIECFENALKAESREKVTPEVLKAVEILKTVRSEFAIKETAWIIKKFVCNLFSGLTGVTYVYIKGGPVDVEALKGRVSQVAATAIPVPPSGPVAQSKVKPPVPLTPPVPVFVDVKKDQFTKELQALCLSPKDALVRLQHAVSWVSQADREKVYAFVQPEEGPCYLQGPQPEVKTPITVLHEGFRVMLGRKYPQFGSLTALQDELKNQGYVDASAMEAEIEEVKKQFTGIKKFTSEDEARRALKRLEQKLEPNGAACAVVTQDGIPTKFLVIKKGEEIKVVEINHTAFQNIKSKLEQAKTDWVSQLRRDLGITSLSYDLELT